jgi:hypothetical protein
VTRLLRLELRRSTMLGVLPLIGGLFWLMVYRQASASAPVWSSRAMTMQTVGVSIFAPVVVGVAAWVGGREQRHHLVDLVAATARPRWARQLAAWAGTTGWAVAAYLACVAVLYVLTDRQGAWGGPPWWPVAVGAASVPAFSALGFAAGVVWPTRFTAPLLAIAVFFALELTVQLIHDAQSMIQISPLVAGPWNLGSDPSLGTFYPYLPDLPIAQLLLLASVTAAFVAGLGIGAGSGGPWLRRSAAAITVVGVLVAGTAIGLAGTGRLDPHGMIAIPALHNAAYDKPVPYTPVCSATAIPVCVHPVFAAALPTIVDALEPVLTQLAGLPGVPVRINQARLVYREEGTNGIFMRTEGPALAGTPPELQVILPNQQPGPTMTADQLRVAVRSETARAIVMAVLGAGRDRTPAQQAVMDGILGAADAVAGTGDRGDAGNAEVAAAAQRFAALPLEARRAWLGEHLPRLRSGDVTLDELP